jgi:TP901 family phage tail tape measure protein
MQANMAGMDTKKVGDLRRKFLSAVQATGAFGVEQIRAKSATEKFTESLQKQDVTFGRAIKQRGMFNSVLAEQYRIQKMLAVQWSKSGTGRMTADIIMPKGLDQSLQRINESWKQNAKALVTAKRGSTEFTQASDMMRMRLGLLNEIVDSGANNMIKWGKNTQWAGRQLMVGFTVPFLAFGALAGKAAFDVDTQLTRIAKVYDTTANTMMGKQQELDDMRERSSRNAIEVAKRYGSSITETLQVEAELAAAGMRGQDLLRSTAEIQRIATLGELDHQKAVTMSIALQRAFHLSVGETSDAMNYMNSVENATSLSLQDFAEATPRAASAMAALGVTVQQMGTLLVAMKENGVDAAQGANALRSATARLIRPTKESIQVLKGFGINIEEITQRTGGNLFKSLEILGGEFKRLGLTALEQRQAIAELFGTYQFNRLNAALQGVADQSGQVGRAMDVANQSTEQWAQTAQNEVEKIRESVSGKFRIAIETIRAQLSTMGQPFLVAGTKILGFLTKLIGGFNSMPNTMKVAAASIAVVFAALGPIIMLIGLLGNGIGNLIKFGKFLPSLAVRFKSVTTEQEAQKLLADQTAKMWQNQGQAARMLAAEINNLGVAMGKLNSTQRTAMGLDAGRRGTATTPVEGYYQASTGALSAIGPSGNGRKITNNLANQRKAAAAAENEAYAMYQNPERMAAAGVKWDEAKGKMVDIEASSARTSKTLISGVGKFAAGLSGAALTMALLSGNADKFSGTLMNSLMVATLFAPMMVKAFRQIAASAAFSQVAGMFQAGRAGAVAGGSGAAGGLLGGIKAARPALLRLLPVALRFAGPAGILATGLTLLIKIRGEMAKTRKIQQDINTSAKGWADTIGFVYSEQARGNGAQAKNNSLLEDRAKKIAKAKPGLVAELQNLKEANRMQALYNMAIDEGVKARMHGASADEAKQVVETSLFAAGLKRQEIDELDMVVGRINWDNMGAVIAQTQESFKRQWDIAANNAAGQGRWEGFGRLLTGSMDDLNTKTKEKIKGMSADFYNTWKGLDMKDRKSYFDEFRKSITAQQESAWDYIGKDQKAQLKKYGITSAADYIEATGLGSGKLTPMQGILGGIVSDDDRNRLKLAAEAEREWARSIADANGVSDKNIDNIQTMGDLMQYLDMGVKKNVTSQDRIAKAQDAYSNALLAAGVQGRKLSEAQQLQLLNMYRMQAGLPAVNNLWVGFGDAATDAAKGVDAATAATQKNTQATKEWASAQTEAVKGAMSNAWGMIMDEAMGQYEDQQQAQMDQLDKDAEDLSNRQQRESEKFSRRWDKVFDRFDNRWDKRMEKEQKAEDLRQKMFEAEKARIQRLAEMQNANIDLNSALLRGDVDEAARISTNMDATTEQWRVDDAQAAAGEVAKARQEALQKTQEAERTELENQKKREEKAMERDHKRQTERIEQARKTAQKISEINRKALERDLAKAQEFIPRNAAQVNAYTKRLEKIYADHGVKLDTQSKAWGDMISSAITSSVAAAQTAMSQDAKWEKIGARAANAAVSVFGMDVKGFMKWIRTGDLPVGADDKALNAAAKSPARAGALNKQRAMGIESRHSGGIIGQGGGSRTGYAGSQMPGEVTLNALRGEAVLNRRATRRIGPDGVAALNDGKGGIGGGELGFAQILGMGVGAMMRGAVSQAVETGVINQVLKQASYSGPGFAGASAGKYGSTMLDTEQLSNAAKIMNVGRQMGASPRDLIISLMTALQESSLRNISGGDRDSAGLFQQRPSQGWGSLAQVTDPEYASRQFFEHLLKIKNRDQMSLTAAAQAVQRSAYPDAYAKWEDEAKAIISGSQLTAQQSGKFGAPVIPTRYTRTFAQHGGEGVDLAGSPGQPIYTIGNGRVITSAALHGTNVYDNDGYRSYGEYVVVDHGGMTSLYAHMLPNSRMVRTGDMVRQGQRLGSLGSTGNSSGPHLHFETRLRGAMTDPARVGIPGLLTGGNIKYDNTIANLHKNETVLTAPLSKNLERGIDKMGNTRYNGDTYQFNFDGAVFQKDIDVESAVERVLRKKDSRLGRQRKID